MQAAAGMSRPDLAACQLKYSHRTAGGPQVVVAALTPAVCGRSLRITRWPCQDAITLTGDESAHHSEERNLMVRVDDYRRTARGSSKLDFDTKPGAWLLPTGEYA